MEREKAIDFSAHQMFLWNILSIGLHGVSYVWQWYGFRLHWRSCLAVGCINPVRDVWWV